MVTREENKILKKAVEGDERSLEYLVSAYKNLAYTIAVKIGLTNEDAEEVVQDSFMKAFSSLASFKQASKFSTWLYRIVYNTALTKSGSKKSITTELADNIEGDQIINMDTAGWDVLRKKERKKYINFALAKLTAEDRLIITLYYIAEKGISEICEITDMKKSAIKMRLLRGRKQLQVELGCLLGNEIKDLYEQ